VLVFLDFDMNLPQASQLEAIIIHGSRVTHIGLDYFEIGKKNSAHQWNRDGLTIISIL
jgi:hypothetical protein